MARQTRHLITYILFCVILVLLMLDTLLWQLDPLGIHAYFYGQYQQQFVMGMASHGYNLQSGAHNFGSFIVTVGASGNRIVPDTNRYADCVIAAIGDSVTFGYGVQDNETFVNILARAYPDIQWRNVARSGYSARNIALLQDAYPANGYLWLIINNDHYPKWDYTITTPSRFPSATNLYLEHGLSKPKAPVLDWNTYWQAVADITAHETLVFGFEGESPAIETSEQYPVYFIPAYTDFVSVYDTHPNAAGHQQIADSMMPFLEPFIARICHDD